MFILAAKTGKFYQVLSNHLYLKKDKEAQYYYYRGKKTLFITELKRKLTRKKKKKSFMLIELLVTLDKIFQSLQLR